MMELGITSDIRFDTYNASKSEPTHKNVLVGLPNL